MFNPFSLEGKTVLVTGASSGIGRQCAIDCSMIGARVVIVARDEKKLEETLSFMEGDGHKAYVFDFCNLERIKDFVNKLVLENGKFDGIIHSIGIEITKPIKLLEVEDYEHLYKVNALSGFELIHHFSNANHFNRKGSIVLISSVTSIIARNCVAAYSASKGAIVSASRVMASELSHKEIRVNCISPGTILTPLMQNYLNSLNDEEYKKRTEGFLLGLGKTTDISNACIYLLSDASRWITGQNLVIDGGYTIK